MRCEAITRAGSRCRLEAAPDATWCVSHDPARVEQRRRNARKAGRAGGNGRAGASEVASIKREIRAVLDGVLDGRIDRGAGACAAQLLNVLLRAAELERRGPCRRRGGGAPRARAGGRGGGGRRVAGGVDRRLRKLEARLDARAAEEAAAQESGWRREV